MVIVEMRDQDGIEPPKRTGVDLACATQVGDAVPEERVRKKPDTAQVDEDGGVPDVLDGGSRRSDHGAILRSQPRRRIQIVVVELTSERRARMEALRPAEDPPIAAA
jgi:hypothetical protein